MLPRYLKISGWCCFLFILAMPVDTVDPDSLEYRVISSERTEFKKPFSFLCDVNCSLAFIYSSHDSSVEDRRFGLSCRTLPDSVIGAFTCVWSGYVNEFNGAFAYTCPNEMFVFGMYSDFSDQYKDRRFRYNCCKINGVVTHGCQTEGNFRNDFHQDENVIIPRGMVMKGVISYHKNSPYQDRRFAYIQCYIAKATLN